MKNKGLRSEGREVKYFLRNGRLAGKKYACQAKKGDRAELLDKRGILDRLSKECKAKPTTEWKERYRETSGLGLWPQNAYTAQNNQN
ncbi:jg14292 [Pararge aegeria aegeria]|uniref:Jg14292 protein n=1 Tax=Pararge aegeria aegeria TaxID=348720 RepID=A0A8S4RU33_9NEOP|nr:jg14292 [Pararge aegeria aegeria]